MTDRKEIKLDESHRFRWMLEGTTHPEIYGWVEDQNCNIVKGTAGWYRTTDPEVAARLAREAMS